MHFSKLAFSALAISLVNGHGLITYINGANGVKMPGLSVIEGTPRNCANPWCGSEADTAIIRKNEIDQGRVGPLGKTYAGGPIDPNKNIQIFMGTDSSRALRKSKRQLLDGTLLPSNTRPAPKSNPQDDSPGDVMAGEGQDSGLPTCHDNNVVDFVYRQVNADGAGPLTCFVDPTSGGTDPSAFVRCQMIADVPGLSSISGVAKTDFDCQARIPDGMVCKGEAGGEKNVCILRVNNNAGAGPFGGSIAFIQGPENSAVAAQKLKIRRSARGTMGKPLL